MQASNILNSANNFSTLFKIQENDRVWAPNRRRSSAVSRKSISFASNRKKSEGGVDNASFVADEVSVQLILVLTFTESITFDFISHKLFMCIVADARGASWSQQGYSEKVYFVLEERIGD